ncbi:methylenetetrahydrofolate--tRNA-(uracil(54)-C(5))-methyltransferase (FADH(2)-oxidizing) TrmFO [Elioraea sp.]|jgi:methylenetetrahydrofolate--tRNA-(uracil-5-)-methyltransferase|uniref:methylenetetrahydrofolate--tRNA-(uracil(54)- C(5))-methyltransferase (FADH(2)-oxidizing) TrmFO n=1 Tax=Elioraea sp. TaxID=2185103 RepID=UPI0021DF1253|nr:methylenetetrahydrofolate--tRNA-(uracil(54)-C(5))-methyltransferase (FADH(2)-oxidizing) TrmFO [Elioraea sp.]GIX10100.1 MAG: methylenetetrahydrofolate--tRNA-(uracil-5-)-methyltransferase TrmFO [Elioraea sp.]
MAAPVHVVGAGLAGSEAAWQIASAGVPVILHEMRPARMTEAHRTEGFAELVCSNSFRADDPLFNAVGLLHEEMRRAGSLILRAGDAHRLPAGGALAVDRDGFSAEVTRALAAHPLVTVLREEVSGLPPPAWGSAIIATGPLTAPALAEDIRRRTGEDALAFFDAIAPIVHRDSIDMSVAWMQSRYDKGGGADYINCPLDRAQYEAFVAALLAAETTGFREWETATPYFDGCLPIEVMAARGPDTLRWGPMKPVGLTDPRTGRRPWAVVQLRQDNALGTLWNMVGFQTKLKHAEQVRLFRTIPGLENAEFARLGGLHRNTFLNSPRLLDPLLRLRAAPHVRFAGQITGVEGYVESAAIGLLAGRFAAAEAKGEAPAPPPPETALGALLAHITGGATAETFQPMNINFGLFPPLEHAPKGRERKRAYCERALRAADSWLGRPHSLPAPRAAA